MNVNRIVRYTSGSVLVYLLGCCRPEGFMPWHPWFGLGVATGAVFMAAMIDWNWFG